MSSAGANRRQHRRQANGLRRFACGPLLVYSRVERVGLIGGTTWRVELPRNHARVQPVAGPEPQDSGAALGGKIMRPSTIERFGHVANLTAHYLGHPAAFVMAALSIAAWAISGPMFGFSETWQLVVNTGTTIATFLMVFILQNTQNRDTMALHAKLDELIRAGEASNRYIGIDHLGIQELEHLRSACEAAVGQGRGTCELAATADKGGPGPAATFETDVEAAVVPAQMNQSSAIRTSGARPGVR